MLGKVGMRRKKSKFFPVTVTIPSTFFAESKNLLILDEHKKVFYFHYNKEGKLTFNLPAGKYYSSARLVKLKRFLPYDNGGYPPFAIPLQEVKIYSAENPNKASISLESLIIVVDPKFHDADFKPLKVFTLLHELFHGNFHAKTERERKNPYMHEFIEMKCDRAAGNYMLQNGYNPVQVSLAGKMLLRGQNRRDCISMNSTGRRIRR